MELLLVSLCVASTSVTLFGIDMLPRILLSIRAAAHCQDSFLLTYTKVSISFLGKSYAILLTGCKLTKHFPEC